jgi:hypothetical protein
MELLIAARIMPSIGCMYIERMYVLVRRTVVSATSHRQERATRLLRNGDR